MGEGGGERASGEGIGAWVVVVVVRFGCGKEERVEFADCWARERGIEPWHYDRSIFQVEVPLLYIILA